MVRKTVPGVFLALFFLVSQGSVAQLQQGGGRADAVQWVVNNTAETTTSGVFVTVPDMVVTFPTCQVSTVILSFCAETSTAPSQRLRVQGVVDGVVLAPSEVTMDEEIQGEPNSRQSHCVIFAGSVSVGSHTAEIEWRSDLGGEVAIDERTLTVQYLSCQAALIFSDGFESGDTTAWS